MKTSYRIAVTVAVLMFSAAYAFAQLPKDPEERAKLIAQIMQANARQLTLFDRDGKELNAVGPKDLYTQPVFSPDAKRMAVVRQDLEGQSNVLWIVDLANC
jgi:hypothetical protein